MEGKSEEERREGGRCGEEKSKGGGEEGGKELQRWERGWGQMKRRSWRRRGKG